MKVLVAGTGFAGKGHTAAFRAARCEVVGIVGRTEHVVRDVAAGLGIPFASTDWAAALADLRPDIVSIATPGGAHYDQIKQAIAAGCHVFCAKPMTTTGNTATELHQLAQAKGVKTAFAASFQYMPSVQHAKRLIAEGTIGEPTEIESISHFNLERGIPFGCSHRAEDGGGRLDNNLTHSLAIAQTLVDDKILQISGDVRDDLGRAPKVSGVHDFAKRCAFIPDDLDDPTLEWGESSVEWSYTVIARLGSTMATQLVSVLFKHGGLVPRFNDDHVVIYGTKGAIHLEDHYGSGETEQCWNVLANFFMRDIKGNTVPTYRTFAQGALYQNIIDTIRRSDAWADVTDVEKTA